MAYWREGRRVPEELGPGKGFLVDSCDGSLKGWAEELIESLASAPSHPRLALTGLVWVVSGGL